MKKPATRAEKDHMAAVRELGCLICGKDAQVHHVRGHQFGLKNNFRVVPLCYRHHNDGPFGHCVHQGTKTFEANYMTQEEMLARVNRLLDV